jgi:hypothetical protein
VGEEAGGAIGGDDGEGGSGGAFGVEAGEQHETGDEQEATANAEKTGEHADAEPSEQASEETRILIRFDRTGTQHANTYCE